MRKSRTWPFLDLALRELPEETWETIAGFDGEYEVSSHGRIKSLRRWRQAGNSGYYTTVHRRQPLSGLRLSVGIAGQTIQAGDSTTQTSL